MIEKITFTGVDEKAGLYGMRDIAKKYPKVEFGILLGSKSGDAEYPIYPSEVTVKGIARFCKDMHNRPLFIFAGTGRAL